MDAFGYKNTTLCASNVNIKDIAEKIGTPFYCYNNDYITELYNIYKDALAGHQIAYAIKANSNQAVINLLAKLGAGADIVSLGELKRAIQADVPSDKIIYSGVGKTQEEIDYALNANIGCFNVESEPELNIIIARAKALGKRAPISLRINPNIDAKTHPKIATGLAGNKFGLEIPHAIELYKKAHTIPQIKITGVDVHIGSQICELEPFDQAFSKIVEFINILKSLAIVLEHVDIGGGLGIDYSANVMHSETKSRIENHAKLAIKHFEPLGLKIICEPGRSLVGNAGALITKVIYTKESYNKKFVIVDAAMNDLIRPALYNAKQPVIPVQQPTEKSETIIADLVGPVCETGDLLAENYKTPILQPGELIAILGSGAYGATMASNYNTRLLIPEVMVKQDKWQVIRKRETYENLIDKDIIPQW